MASSYSQKFSLSGFAIIAIIIISAAVFGILSYSYSTYSADLIKANAIDAIHSNAQVSAHDVAEMLRNRIVDVQNNIKIISDAPLVQQGKVDSVHILFSTAQSATSDIADSYFWVDSQGKLLWSSSFENATIYNQFAGADRSDREYYKVPKQTLHPYITKVINSVDNVPRLFVAQPIISSDNQSPAFRGVLVASIRVVTLGRFLEEQQAPQFQSTIGMLDKEGQILYSTDHTAIGQNVYGEEFQSKLPAGLKDDFNRFLDESLEGNTGYQDLSYQGNSGTLAYQPIEIDNEIWAVMYAVLPHTLANTVQSEIDSQRNLSTIMIIAISAIAIGLAALVIRWNGDLNKLVRKRTNELEAKTEELRQSNESLLASNSKLEAAYDELLVHDKLQREFINIAAHELRTPIQPILSVAELFEEEANSAGGVDKVLVPKEDIVMLHRNAKRLEKLSSDILHVSRLESSGIKLELEEFDLCQKIRNVIKDRKLDPSTKNKNLEINFSATQEKIMVEADKSKIFEVLSNLLNNAIKFTKEGTISIFADYKETIDESGKSSTEAIVLVKDTGIGIAENMLPRLFSKFVSNDQIGGTGLGLYISKKIIEAHGGRIWAENNKNERGATFGFSLPAIPKPTNTSDQSNKVTDKDSSMMMAAIKEGNQNVKSQS